MMEEKKKSFAVPAAIVIAGIIIASAVIFTNKSVVTAPAQPAANPNPAEENDVPSALDTYTNADALNVYAVTADDHVLGNPRAPVIIIEYSDTECPFCKNFHGTMNQVVAEYGKRGDVAWVYRHFPLDSIHPKARKEAEATECVAELGGNAKFWDYLNKIFEVTPSNDGLDPALLPRLAEDIGINRAAFESCLASGKYAGKVQSQFQSGISAGVEGTPHSLVVTPRGNTTIAGAQQYPAIKAFIDRVLEALSATSTPPAAQQNAVN